MKRLKKGTPGKGDESPRDSFTHVPVGSGLKNVWTGWLAGETYWALSHEHTTPRGRGVRPRGVSHLRVGPFAHKLTPYAARVALVGERGRGHWSDTFRLNACHCDRNTE